MTTSVEGLAGTRYGPELTAGVAALSGATVRVVRPAALPAAAVVAPREVAVAGPAAAFGWGWLVLAASGALLLVLLAEGVALRDWPALVLAGIAAVGLTARLRWKRLATAGLTLLFLDVGFYTLTGAISNALHGEALLSVAIPAALAACSLAGVVAAVASIVWHGDARAGAEAAPFVALGAMVVFLLLPLVAVVRANGPTTRRPERVVARLVNVSLQAERMAYSQTRIEAKSGEVTLALGNRDLFWHTFTIDALGVDLKVPVGGGRTVTFAASPGNYVYYCAVPAHEQLGMRGTLVVR